MFSTSEELILRTGMNFANLASFQAIGFVEQPVPKTRDNLLCDMRLFIQGFLHKAQHSVNYAAREERARRSASSCSSHSQFPRSPLRTPGTMTRHFTTNKKDGLINFIYTRSTKRNYFIYTTQHD